MSTPRLFECKLCSWSASGTNTRSGHPVSQNSWILPVECHKTSIGEQELLSSWIFEDACEEMDWLSLRHFGHHWCLDPNLGHCHRHIMHLYPHFLVNLVKLVISIFEFLVLVFFLKGIWLLANLIYQSMIRENQCQTNRTMRQWCRD